MSKKHEQVMMKKLNSFNIYKNFEENTDPYGSYDLHNEDFIVEVKWRRQHYDDQIMEKSKFDRNIETADRTNRDFIYLVRTSRGCYAWNISKLMREGMTFDWFIKALPESAEFERRTWIDKAVCSLQYADAKEFKLC